MPWYYFVYFYSLFFHPAPQPVWQPAYHISAPTRPAVIDPCSLPYADGPRRCGEVVFAPSCTVLSPMLAVCR